MNGVEPTVTLPFKHVDRTPRGVVRSVLAFDGWHNIREQGVRRSAIQPGSVGPTLGNTTLHGRSPRQSATRYGASTVVMSTSTQMRPFITL